MMLSKFLQRREQHAQRRKSVCSSGCRGFHVCSGGLWYSPILFGRAWQREVGLSDEQVRTANVPKTFGFSFVFSVVMALNLAAFLADPKTNTTWGVTAGFLAGFGWVALGLGIVALFEQKSWKYLAINGGYMTVAFVVMGAIIGAWR